jgi:hypothetical protein
VKEVPYLRDTGRTEIAEGSDPAGINHYKIIRATAQRGPRNRVSKSVRLELPLDDETQIERDLMLLGDAVARAIAQCKDTKLRAQPGVVAHLVRKQLEGVSQVLRRRVHSQ